MKTWMVREMSQPRSPISHSNGIVYVGTVVDRELRKTIHVLRPTFIVKLLPDIVDYTG